ncbi:hypothetical protein ASE21_10195 [Flavobacterium sp. Root901]|uniref:family 16 glycoside hydrolase n=1 Tax=Flavobacterium sp. Root901 TaxID=1736605 RepID=UPI00070E7F79|nr:family 16 glycoside hydrolase [Flavobacterium sp. Root901]KRD10083.1 hypothetical protein ASE21_10195 [Flavobacterium sp. Root901]
MQKYTTGILLFFILISCSPTLSTKDKEYQISEKTKFEKEWKFEAKEWSLENKILEGNGSAEHWAAIISKKNLPENYEITFEMKLLAGNLTEVMLNFDKTNYIRAYAYNIDKNIIIGRGTYNEKSDEYGKRGGPTLLKKPFDFTSNIWHLVKIKVQNNQLQFTVNDNITLECSLEKYNLSSKGKLGFITNGKTEIKNLVIKTL